MGGRGAAGRPRGPERRAAMAEEGKGGYSGERGRGRGPGAARGEPRVVAVGPGRLEVALGPGAWAGTGGDGAWGGERGLRGRGWGRGP